MPTTTAPRIPVATPKVSPKAVKADDRMADIVQALTEAKAESSRGTLSGADIASVLIATGHLPDVGTKDKDPRSAQGLKVRTYMRKAAGAWVGKGGTYAGTVSEAAAIAYGFLNDVPAPKGGSFVRGMWVPAEVPADA